VSRTSATDDTGSDGRNGPCILPAVGAPAKTEESQPMLDVVMLVIGIGFFAAAVAYAFACERL
jgi:hypothetical protein